MKQIPAELMNIVQLLTKTLKATTQCRKSQVKRALQGQKHPA